MAKRFGSQLDLLKIPVLGFVPESSSTAPSAPVAGQLWLDTGVSPSRLKVYENGAWTLVSQVGTVLTTTSHGGDVSGTYDNLQIVANAVGTTEVANDAVTFAKMQNVTTDRLIGRDAASAGDPEELTVGGGVEFTGSGGIQTSAFTGDVTKTAGGTALTVANNAVTLAKIASSVTLSALATTYPATADVTANNQKITNVGTPTNATDAANKGYVDGLAQGLDVKASVRAATTATVGTYNATAGSSSRGQLTAAPNTLDGVTLAAGNRILVKNHSTAAANGIYTVTTLGTGANGVWDRATDFDSDAEVTGGAFTFVEEGTTNGDTGWVVTTNDPITIGGASGTSLTFAQFSGGASLTAGAGLVQTGNAFDVVGTSNRISVAADAIDIAATYVGQTSITTLGTVATGTWNATTIALNKGGTGATDAAGARANLGATTKFAGNFGALTAGVEATIAHNLNTTDIVVSFKTTSDNRGIDFDWRTVDANTIGVTADVAFGSGAVRAIVVG